MPHTVEECRTEAVAVLRDEFPPCKNTILALEVYLRTRSKRAVYELRDFLSHLSAIFQRDVSVAAANHHLSECRTHLRRASVEPMEYMAEKNFVRLDRLNRYFGWAIWKKPTARREFVKAMLSVKELIAEGREKKSESAAAEVFRTAFERTEDLLVDAHPLRTFVTAVVWTLVAIAAGVFGRFGEALAEILLGS